MALHTSSFRPCCLCVACSIRSAVDVPSVPHNSTHSHSFFCAVSNHQMPLPAPACVWMPRVQKSSPLLSSCTAHTVSAPQHVSPHFSTYSAALRSHIFQYCSDTFFAQCSQYAQKKNSPTCHPCFKNSFQPASKLHLPLRKMWEM